MKIKYAPTITFTEEDVIIVEKFRELLDNFSNEIDNYLNVDAEECEKICDDINLAIGLDWRTFETVTENFVSFVHDNT